jgi:hypothetical protein
MAEYCVCAGASNRLACALLSRRVRGHHSAGPNLAPLIASMLAIAALIGCTSSDYRYGVRQPLPGDALANPRVGIAVLVDIRDPAAGDAEGLPSGFASAAEDALRSRGYEPTVLESRVIREDIHDSLLPGGISANKYRKLRPMLQEPVFTKATAQGMAGVFVVWVSATRVSPSDLDQSGSFATQSYTGTAPVLTGMCMIEVLSSKGESLKVFGANISGLTITTMDRTVRPEGGALVQRGSYLVVTPEEAAAKSIKEAFTTLGGLPPYSGPR